MFGQAVASLAMAGLTISDPSDTWVLLKLNEGAVVCNVWP